MKMCGEFDRCNFCRNNPEFGECPIEDCENGYSYRIDPDKVIAKAKERGITVSDVICLVDRCN